MGSGFIVDPARASALQQFSNPDAASPCRDYRNGRDLAGRPRGVQVIDLFGWDEADVRRIHPGVYQHLLETVKPERDRNNRASYRDNWWIFGEPRSELRPALKGLGRYIATVETAKHRWFRFLDEAVLPDNKLVVIASNDPAILGVLSSRLHQQWFVANSGRIGVYDGDAVYVKGVCFDAFPFPDLGGKAGTELAALAEELDDLRHRVLERHGQLTMTGLYNARARLPSGESMTAEERAVHEAGHVGLLDHLHGRIDAVTAQAYGWPAELPAHEAVARLARLNRERGLEEARGDIRFLRHAYQKPRYRGVAQPVQIEAPLAVAHQPPPLPEGAGALAPMLLTALRAEGAPMQPSGLAAGFSGRRGRRMEERIEQTLAILAVAGSVQRAGAGWYAPRRERV